MLNHLSEDLRSLLIQYLAEVLDPPDTVELERLLEAEPALAHDLAVLRSTYRPPEPPQLPAWRIPPPGVQIGFGGAVSILSAPVLSEGAIRIGSRVRLQLPPLDDAALRELVILRRCGGAWTVLSPRDPSEVVRLSQLTRQPSGEHLLDLTVPGPPGRSRVAVALPMIGGIDWQLEASERWAPLQRELALGEVPLVSFELDAVA
ncbi:MAG TPA: hypothetical protein ENK18_00865 [Deltaproteobacteria bacterium]|nr:hypothetical protein [Deltaproteobacteria bacterium]